MSRATRRTDKPLKNGRGYGRATLGDVARLAGVSPITVSRALRSPEQVAEATRTRIAASVAELGYLPNLVAGSLASRRTRTVAAVIPTLGNSIFTEVLQGMMSVLRPAGYSLIVGDSRYSLTEELELVQTFLSRQVDALMLTGALHDPHLAELLAAQPVPVVETWSLPEAGLDMCVGFSNFMAARAMTRALLEHGYRKIGFVSAPTDQNERAAERLAGYRAALGEVGRTVHPGLILERTFGLSEGARALATLKERHPDLDAVFFANDTLAAGALLECARRGWAVPGRVAVAGFDDLEIAAQMVPQLSTVRVFRREMGVHAAELLLKRLAGEAVASPYMDLGFELILREST